MDYIGKKSTLNINRFTSVGAYLEDGEGFEVLLPNKYLTDDLKEGDDIQVFVYNDSEDRPVATTEEPKIALNYFAYLKVKEVTQFGAFLDWGLEKDLLVPFKEQTAKMVEDGVYLVCMIKDEQTDRLIASARINKFLEPEITDLHQDDVVELFIGDVTDLGRKVIVNKKYNGLIFKNHIVRPLRNGEITKGYVQYIRDDGKLDISLVPNGPDKFDEFTEHLWNYIQQNNGVIPITDKSSPDLIRSEVGMSKKSFKKAVGDLYKKKKIVLEKGCIKAI